MHGEFWLLKNKNPEARLYYKSTSIDYFELEARVQKAIKTLPSQRCLIALVAHSSLDFVIYYLALIRCSHVILLIDPAISEPLSSELLSHYQVNHFIDGNSIQMLNEQSHDLADELCLLLSTSGSTGSSKLVKLSKQNLAANCVSITQCLPICQQDVVMTFLPLSYSFGLSILHTHLMQGASIVLQSESLMSATFWQAFEKFKVTSFYGVPLSYQLLNRLGPEKMPLGRVRYMAQAGGRLLARDWKMLSDFAISKELKCFVMYGQTEATARIAYLPAEHFNSQVGCIGVPIPGVEIQLVDSAGELVTNFDSPGELCVRGENIFGGYAASVSSLSFFERLNLLKTGDIALKNASGLYKIIGRSKRICKIAGRRINLDEIQSWLEVACQFEVVCVGSDDDVTLYAEQVIATEIIKQLATKLQCHSRLISFQVLNSIPRLSNSKVDYNALKQ
jgi:acyl-CoA synthetase (AMP-forming)/AMP-acid ligase II